MLEVSGILNKLHTMLDPGAPVEYSLKLDNDLYSLTNIELINIEFYGEIYCINCQGKTNKSFNQGYCFSCFRKLASCDLCIMSPERCSYYSGGCREPSWGEEHCMIDHVVYIANSSDLKVGLTRANQLPTRWIDQGATQALVIARVSSRYQAGLLEVICKEHLKDKTNWRIMLKSDNAPMDLYIARDELYNKIEKQFLTLQQQFPGSKLIWCSGNKSEQIIDICYPVKEYPNKITSYNLDATPNIQGYIRGIKGQYIILDNGVINIRKYTGYKVKLTLKEYAIRYA